MLQTVKVQTRRWMSFMQTRLDTLLLNRRLSASARPLEIPESSVASLCRAWAELLEHPTPRQADSHSPAERDIIERIRRETDAANRTNVTRTAAYWDFYARTPELHWAFLAHMVSRNGGWTMTDLQGEHLSRLIGPIRRRNLFRMLERSNALIFHDAYPQLRLYEESKRLGRPLFHLLPAFGVSRFMQPVWERFWDQRQPVELTVCLIINEQQVIEQNVIRDEQIQARVLKSLPNRLQALLHLNHILIPYGDGRLAGVIVERFASLPARIETGKQLYGMLFGIPAVHQGALRFACARPHTGSRSDYWPEMFSALRDDRGQPDTDQTGHPSLVFSPTLEAAWPVEPFLPPLPGDWFRRLEPAKHVSTVRAPRKVDMTNEARFRLTELSLLAKAVSSLKDTGDRLLPR